MPFLGFECPNYCFWLFSDQLSTTVKKLDGRSKLIGEGAERGNPVISHTGYEYTFYPSHDVNSVRFVPCRDLHVSDSNIGLV